LIVGAFVSSRSIELLEQHIDFSLLGLALRHALS
jgi:hypothetical protein